MADEPQIGSHLISPRKFYTHHGIYIGNGRVIHYSGLADGLQSGPVEEIAITTFASKKGFVVKSYKKSFPAEEIVSLAKSRVGEDLYDIVTNNCEHFCLSCIVGVPTSDQVEKAVWVSASSAATIAGLVARGAVAASGPIIGLSGPGIMSGLATIGSLVGGGAVAGIGVIGAVPGAAMASLVNKTVLSDNPTLGKREKESRKAGRVGSYAGAAAGTFGSIFTVSVVGSSGLSAAGISTGLATVGSVVGGGMAAGVFLASLTPVITATAVGFGVYKAVRKFKKSSCEKNHPKDRANPPDKAE